MINRVEPFVEPTHEQSAPRRDTGVGGADACRQGTAHEGDVAVRCRPDHPNRRVCLAGWCGHNVSLMYLMTKFDGGEREPPATVERVYARSK